MPCSGTPEESAVKTMTCEQLGGACGKAFRAETFDEIAEMSKHHGMEMFKANDGPHLDAMSRMRDLMQEPEAMREWFEGRRAAFEALPDD